LRPPAPRNFRHIAFFLPFRGVTLTQVQTGAAMSYLSQITFFEVTMSLLAVGLVERLLYRLPVEVVGPGGWLLDTGRSDQSPE
jgi:hypothetical protein